MVTIQFIGTAIAFLLGLVIFGNSRGAIHDGVAALFITISAILFAGAAITRAINRLNDTMIELQPLPPASAAEPSPEEKPVRGWADIAREEQQAGQNTKG